MGPRGIPVRWEGSLDLSISILRTAPCQEKKKKHRLARVVGIWVSRTVVSSGSDRSPPADFCPRESSAVLGTELPSGAKSSL